MSRPWSRSACVIVVRSHLTKKASSGLLPGTAPDGHSFIRKASTARLMSDQSGSAFGSKTAPCAPLSIDASRARSRRGW
jgi:hypothetical protein